MDKRDREMLDERKKRIELIGYMAVFIVLVGFVVLWMNIGNVSMLAMELEDNDHITDDSMAVRDMDNATYTWTAEELESMMTDDRNIVLLGAGVMAIGIALLVPVFALTWGPIEMHRTFCKNDGEKCYCPECGIKMSRLEPKK